MPGYEFLGPEEREEILSVIDKGVLFRYEFKDQRGDQWKVRQFEEAVCRFTGARHALAVSSGSTALKVGLTGVGLGPGDEVICPVFTFVATWEAIFEAGCEPVFADVDESLCLDPQRLEARITPRTKAIMLVHMCGAGGDVAAVSAVAKKHGLLLLEDTAQAVGSRIEGRHVGTFGQFGTFSFDAVKTVTLGEGGMVLTNDDEIYKNFCEYHDHGHDHRPVGRGNEGRRFVGFNYRVNELHGALGLVQLRKLPKMLEVQKTHKARLKAVLEKVPGVTFRRLPDPEGDSATFICWFHRTPQEAEKFNAALAQAGCGAIPWSRNTWHYYRHWEHLHGAKTVVQSGWPFVREDGRKLSYPPDAFPASDQLMSRMLSWQIMLNMTEDRFRQLEAAVAQAAKAMA